MGRRMRKLKDNIIRKSKEGTEARKAKFDFHKKDINRVDYSVPFESKEEKFVRKAVEKSLANEVIPNAINKYLDKINEKIDEVATRLIRDRFNKEIKIKKVKILLKDFNIKEFIHGEYKKWHIVFDSSKLNSKTEPYLVLERTTINDK